MAAESPRKSGSRVFETQVDEGEPTGFRRYINVVAITVPILIGVVLVVVIARSLNGPARPALPTAGGVGPSAGAAPVGAGPSTPAAAPSVAAIPTPSSSPTPALAAKALPSVAAAVQAASPSSAPPGSAKPAAVTTSTSAGSGDAILTLPPYAAESMRISGEDLQYPAIARDANVQGKVVIDIVISKTGTVENLKVVSGPPLLENAALTAVRTYRYRPIPVNGKPVRVRTQVVVGFVLHAGAASK